MTNPGSWIDWERGFAGLFGAAVSLGYYEYRVVRPLRNALAMAVRVANERIADLQARNREAEEILRRLEEIDRIVKAKTG